VGFEVLKEDEHSIADRSVRFLAVGWLWSGGGLVKGRGDTLRGA
jgi:hypothetical protein